MPSFPRMDGARDLDDEGDDDWIPSHAVYAGVRPLNNLPVRVFAFVLFLVVTFVILDSLQMAQTAAPPGLQVTVSATPQSGAVPLRVTVSATVEGGSGPYDTTWNFGDGNTVEITAWGGAGYAHTYYQAGTYDITASVTDANGNQGEASAWVSVT